MSPRALIHDKMFARLHEFYPITVTIQEATEPQDTYGAPKPRWTNKIGYVDLPCRLAPAGGEEVKRADQTYVVASHIIAIGAFYPGIDEKSRAVVGTQTFNILLVESDGQSESTRLAVELVD